MDEIDKELYELIAEIREKVIAWASTEEIRRDFVTRLDSAIVTYKNGHAEVARDIILTIMDDMHAYGSQLWRAGLDGDPSEW